MRYIGEAPNCHHDMKRNCGPQTDAEQPQAYPCVGEDHDSGNVVEQQGNN